jgi:hypothetical protein
MFSAIQGNPAVFSAIEDYFLRDSKVSLILLLGLTLCVLHDHRPPSAANSISLP